MPYCSGAWNSGQNRRPGLWAHLRGCLDLQSTQNKSLCPKTGGAGVEPLGLEEPLWGRRGCRRKDASASSDQFTWKDMSIHVPQVKIKLKFWPPQTTVLFKRPRLICRVTLAVGNHRVSPSTTRDQAMCQAGAVVHTDSLKLLPESPIWLH